MDLQNCLEEEVDFVGDTPALGWEGPFPDRSLSSSRGPDLSQGNGHNEPPDPVPGGSGPLLRCLKRIFHKVKKERMRRRRTMTSVPDLSGMATIWEENENSGSSQEPELLLQSWRSSMDYFSSKKEDDVMKKSFLRFLSILSKTINWSNMTELFMDNFTSDVVGAITEMIKRELPEPSVICLYAMSTIIDLSKRQVTKAMGSYRKGILLRTFFKSVFSLSPMKLGQEEEEAEHGSAQYTQDLFVRIYQTFSEMLQQLMVENPVAAELERILQLMTPWLQSPEDDLRERAIWSSVSLLSFVASKLRLDTMCRFSRLGHLVAVLGICCGDPIKSISSKAAKSIHLLLMIVLGRKIAKLEDRNAHTEAIKRKHKEFLETWNPTVFLKNPARVAEVFGVYFSPREKTDFILTALDGLTEQSSSACCATTEGLLASMARNCGTEIEKVSDIVEGICSRLDLIQQSSARRLVMKLVGLLAGKTKHLDTVISSLLEHSFPNDSSSSELWQSLSTEDGVEEQLVENLLARLKKQHSSELEASPAAVPIMHALHEVISVPDSRDTVQRLFPELLTTFLVQLHFSSQAEASPEDKPFSRWYGPGGSLTSYTVETIKLLLLRMGCRYEVTFMEKMRGWAMLQNTGEMLQGAALLARSMLHFACPETMRILDFLFSQLGKGSEVLKPPAIAFFVELLHCQEIEQLPAEQLCESLSAWTRSPDPDVRSLGLRALGILAIHPDKVEDVKALVPTLLASLEEAEGAVLREALTAVQSLLKFMQRNDIISLAEKLLPLFNNVDAKARRVSMALFAELPNTVKKKEKYLIQEQVTQSVLPLLLHLQDEEPEVVKACQEALAKCFRFLGWALPKKISSKKAWHDHPQIAESVCRQMAWKVKTIPAILLQCLDHLQCPQVSIRRAAAIFIGCIVQCTEPAAITKEKEDLILLSLSKLKQDPDASVRLTARHAIQMVQEASVGTYATPGSRIPLHHYGGLQRDRGICEWGHWSASDPALTHRFNPAPPLTHRIVANAVRRRLYGPGRQA